MARHLAALDRAVVDAIDGRSDEQIIVVEMPPRHGKSLYCSQWLPAWYLGMHPNRRVMLTSYSADLSRTFGRAARDHLSAYGSAFGVKVREDVKSASFWQVHGYDGGMLTAGVGGPLTGFGANLAIIDDPLKNAEEALSDRIREKQVDWFISTLWTRLEPNSVLLVIQTRWHQEDLAGWILTHARDELGVGVKQLSFPALATGVNDPLGREAGEALWPKQWPAEKLAERKKILQGYWWDALFQQQPGIYGNAEWPREYFDDHIWAEEWPDRFEDSVVFIDPSKGKDARKGDYSANVFVGYARGLVWVSASIERRPVERIVTDALRQHYSTGAEALAVEANAFQELLGPELQRVAAELGLVVPDVMLVTNSVNKNMRISRLGAPLEHQQIRIKRNAGGELLVKQLKDFPFGDHDDGPDALENGIRILNSRLNEPPSQDEERWSV